MAKTVAEAAATLVPELREHVNFFADEDRRNFIDPTMLQHIAEALIAAFGTGMAAEMGKTAGHELMIGVIDKVKTIMHGQKPDPTASEQAISSARSAITGRSAEGIGAAATTVETQLRQQLASALPDQDAARLAVDVRKQTLATLGHG